MPSSVNVFNVIPSWSDNFATRWPTMYLTPAVFAASSNLCVIIPSSIRYSISDCPEILPTNSLIATLKTSLDNFVRLSKLIPNDIFKIAESGISNHNDALKMVSHGANGLLVGESIMKSNNIGQIIQEIKENNNET